MASAKPLAVKSKSRTIIARLRVNGMWSELFLAWARRRCCRGSRAFRRRFAFGAFDNLFFLLLGFLYDQLDDFYLGQAVGAASVGPAVFLLHLQNALAARKDVPRSLQGILATQAFIDGHGG